MPSYANVDAFLLSVSEEGGVREKYEKLVAQHVETYGVPFKNLLDLYACNSAVMWRQLTAVLGKQTTSSLWGAYRSCRECEVTNVTSIHWLDMLFKLAERLTEDNFKQLGAL